MKKYPLSLFIFRRDLRLDDNTALLHALKLSKQVIPCFILDERQLSHNPYRGDNAVQFMVQSLKSLHRELATRGARLYLFQGIAEEVVRMVIAHEKISAVFFNRDYTPFSKMRDSNIVRVCNENSIACHIYADALLTEPEFVCKSDGAPYTVFTHFLKKATQFTVPIPVLNHYSNYYNKNIPFELSLEVLDTIVKRPNASLILQGGRREALTLLKRISHLQEYHNTRNYPAIDGTSFLSAHLKFGTVSIREVYHTAKKVLPNHEVFTTELYWRDFFTHIAYHFPHVFGQSFRQHFDTIAWNNDEKMFEAWKQGITGFPIVDAGMRQLNATGFMHNRVRMIVASFLVKDLHIDWRLGEQYFARTLVDYDPSVNNGNWQWAASTGCDAVPYFRIFNPWIQQKKYDPHCEYIKRWIPELQSLPPAIIHNWYRSDRNANYPKPIVDHVKESMIARIMFKNVSK